VKLTDFHLISTTNKALGINIAIVRAMNHPDNGGSTHLWNVGLLTDYTALCPGRLLLRDRRRENLKFNLVGILCSMLLLWKHEDKWVTELFFKLIFILTACKESGRHSFFPELLIIRNTDSE
jgi:hypothetical protein